MPSTNREAIIFCFFKIHMAQSYIVLCIGDSHTAGFPYYDPMMGGNPESSYQFWLKQELLRIHPDADYQLINEGMCGDTARGIVIRLQHALKTSAFNLVILSGGTNDLGMIEEAQIFNNLQAGYESCREKGLPVIAPGIPPIRIDGYETRVEALNNKIKNYAEHHPDVLFADWFAALQDEHGYLRNIYDSGDGVHLSVAGYKCIGLLLAPLVKGSCTQAAGNNEKHL
jgi:lysophospholipase L1-like esterase